jgi:hypothetical protein
MSEYRIDESLKHNIRTVMVSFAENNSIKFYATVWMLMRINAVIKRAYEM